MGRLARTLLLSSLVVSLTASTARARPTDWEDAPLFIDTITLQQPSHLPLHEGTEDLASPEEALARRLSMSRNLRDVQKMDDRFKADLGALAQKLLKDDRFRESIEKQFSREDLDQIRAKLKSGDFSGKEKELRDLIEQTKNRVPLTPRDENAFNRLKQKVDEQGGLGGDQPRTQGPPNGVPPPREEHPDGPNPSAPPQGAWNQPPAPPSDWFKKSLDGAVKNVEAWVGTPTGQSWADTVRNVVSRAEANRSAAPTLGNQTSGIGGWLTRLGSRARPLLGNPASLPPLPGPVGRPALPGTDALAAAGQALVVLICLGVVALILFRSRDWFTALQARVRRGWRLGPWPVRPDQVSTRGDLVRAFEYLALLCLGPTARTCHHLELGQRLGELPALDAERRREAAHDLAGLYEQARYTPDEEALPGEDLGRARRELAYLAGIASV